MTRDQLEHAIRAVCDLVATDDLVIIGSQAILGQFPDAPAALRKSMEIDIIPRHRESAIDTIAGVMGELSQFHVTHGFYVDAVLPSTARLPRAWEARLVPVRGPSTRGATGWCLEVGDIAASKLMAFREKDRDYVQSLLQAKLLAPKTLIERLRTVEATSDEIEARVRWVEALRVGR